jgi:hypothetical protein
LLEINTCHEWILELAAQSNVIADMHLETQITPTADLNDEALNLANCPAHRRLIIRAVEGLCASTAGSSHDDARDLLCNLIRPKTTYGAFAELAAYEWLNRCYVQFDAQVRLTPTDVLGLNGSTLDGKIKFGPYPYYFDVKAFGFNGRAARRLQECLQLKFPDEQVFVDASWDISLTTFQEELIEKVPTIVEELRAKRYFRKGPLEIRLQHKQPVAVSHRVVEPYRLARENARFLFEKAHQFVRNAPFALLYVIHPWFNAGAIHNDFAGVDTTLTRSLARRAFMQFSNDATPLLGTCDKVPPATTIGDASRLRSAIFFVNVWPSDADQNAAQRLPSWLYINPRATNPIGRTSLSLFQAQNPHGTHIDDFADDDY